MIFVFITAILWILAVGMYYDASRLRRQDVPILPGVIAGVLLIAAYGWFLFGDHLLHKLLMPPFPPSISPQNFSQGFSQAAFTEYVQTSRRISNINLMVTVLFPLVLYVMLRIFWFGRAVRAADAPPLPPAPLWTKIFFWFALVVPFILFVLALFWHFF